MLVLSLFFRVRIISALVPRHAAAGRGACRRRTPREALASPRATLACAPRPPGRADARAASCRSRLAHRRLERRAVPPPRHPCAAAASPLRRRRVTPAPPPPRAIPLPGAACAGPAWAAAARATARAAVGRRRRGPSPPLRREPRAMACAPGRAAPLFLFHWPMGPTGQGLGLIIFFSLC